MRITTLIAGGLALVAFARMGMAQSSVCDLNSDSTVNVVDVQLAVNMYLGTTPCTATVEGTGVCNQDVVSRVKTAAIGGTCVTGPGPHSVTLNWTASTSPNLKGYYVYRAGVSGGPYKKMNSTPVVGTSYVDYNIDGGFTYYYVATAVDTSNNESTYSSQAGASVPTP